MHFRIRRNAKERTSSIASSDFDSVLRRDSVRNLDCADGERVNDVTESEGEDDGSRPGERWCNESRDDRLDEPFELNQRGCKLIKKEKREERHLKWHRQATFSLSSSLLTRKRREE